MIAINPKLLVDPVRAYTALNKVIDLDQGMFMNSAHNKSTSFVTIKERINDAQAAGIQKLGIIGVIISPQVWREYPAH